MHPVLLSKRVAAWSLLIMGYSPYLLGWFIGLLGDYYQWGQLYMNELAAVAVALSVFHFAAIV